MQRPSQLARMHDAIFTIWRQQVTSFKEQNKIRRDKFAMCVQALEEGDVSLEDIQNLILSYNSCLIYLHEAVDNVAVFIQQYVPEEDTESRTYVECILKAYRHHFKHACEEMQAFKTLIDALEKRNAQQKSHSNPRPLYQDMMPPRRGMLENLTEKAPLINPIDSHPRYDTLS